MQQELKIGYWDALNCKWVESLPMTDTLGTRFHDVLLQAEKVFGDRQAKYGPGNIAAFGEMGCVVRAQDKLARLINFHFKQGSNATDETVEDTWIDLLNYAAIGLLCHRNQWPSA